MADYIDRQVAVDTVSDCGICIQKILDLPSADVVEVVRCKDCKYQDKGENESESWNVCNYRPWLYFSINDDDYCSNGERRTDGSDK